MDIILFYLCYKANRYECNLQKRLLYLEPDELLREQIAALQPFGLYLS